MALHAVAIFTAGGIAVPVHDRLLWYVIGAAVLGLLLPGWAIAIQWAVPVMLAGQVIGVALTLTIDEFAGVVQRSWVVAAALLIQWSAMPLAGIALLHFAPDRTVGQGAFIVSVAPSEITSALVAIVAGGSGALAASCMAGSLLLSTILTPLWLAAVLGPAARVDEWGLVSELLLSVTLPLLLGVVLRTRVPALARHRGRCLDVAAISVLLVVFVGAGSARRLPVSGVLIAAAAACVFIAVMGYAVGQGLGRLLGLPLHEKRAVLFPVGMREFGVATAVAVAVDPPAAAVAGLYGIVIMAGASAVVAVVAPHRVGRRPRNE